MLDNKLKITNEIDLAHEEERITKLNALNLFDNNIIDTYEVGTFNLLSQIHYYLFKDIYNFAGVMRHENIAKGNFRFASAMHLQETLNKIDNMPQDTFDNIINKYLIKKCLN